MPLRPRRAVDQLAAAVGTHVVQRFGAWRAEGAFEAADERARRLGGQVRPATFAVGAHFEGHQAAAFLTASQIESTTRSTSPASSPSAITRIFGSVPDLRITSRPRPSSARSPSAIAALTAAAASGSPPSYVTFL